ncbi:MAG TPA: hypothetical protein VFW78_06405 [Bacteroidia bacterium]|nr:hypothetical protein [Bacteroidia bacterium]
MAQLVCTHCGFANEVRSEYLILCNNCGKKLGGTFNEWKKEHPGKSFNAYKEYLDAEHLKIQAETEGGKVREKNAGIAGTITTVVLIVVLVGAYLYRSNRLSFFSQTVGTTPSSILKGEWKRYTCGRFGLSVMLPGKMKEIKESEAEAGTETESFHYDSGSGLEGTFRAQNHNIVTTDLETAVNRAVNRIVNKPGVSDVNYNAAPVSSGDLQGLLIEGTFNEEGYMMSFYCAVYVKTSLEWEVTVRHLKGDENGAEAAQRILDSVEINYFGSSV